MIVQQQRIDNSEFMIKVHLPTLDGQMDTQNYKFEGIGNTAANNIIENFSFFLFSKTQKVRFFSQNIL